MQLKICKHCSGKPKYKLNAPSRAADWVATSIMPEHWVECSGCDYKTEVYCFSVDAVKEWNSKKDF